MDAKVFLKLLPGCIASAVLAVLLVLTPSEELLNVNRLIVLFFVPLPVLVNYVAVNIKRIRIEAVDLDYLFLITHMSSVSTGRPSRQKLFEIYSITGQAYGTYSKTMNEISQLAKRWGYSYIQAIRYYLKRIKNQTFRDFLSRFAEALNMGEDETMVLETERNIATTNYEARYHRSLDVLRVLLGIYAAAISSAIFINVNMFIIAVIMWGNPLVIIVSLFASVVAISSLVYVIYRLAPRDRLLHRMRIQPRERKTIAYSVLASSIVGAVIWFATGMFTRDVNYAFIALSISFVFPGLLARNFENKIKRLEMFFQAFIRSYGMTYSVVKSHIVTLRSLLRVDLGPLTPAVRRLYTRLSNGIDKRIAWMYFAGEAGSENIRRCVDVVYDTIDSGGDVARVGVVLSETLLKISNLREIRRQVARAFQGVVYVLHVIMVILLEFIVALMGVMYISIQAVAGAGILPFPAATIDVSILHTVKALLLVMLSVVNAIAIKVSEGGYMQTFWLHLSVFLVLSITVSLASSGIARIMYEMVNIEELLGAIP